MIRTTARSVIAHWRTTRAYAWRERIRSIRIGRPQMSAIPRQTGSRAGPTFTMICGGQFNIAVPNAATTCRVGWCNGFEALGVPATMISALALEQELSEVSDPFCWIAASDYIYLNRRNLAALAAVPHAVLVDPWFRGEQAFWHHHDYPALHNPAWLREAVLSTQPRFLFTISPQSSMAYYEGWQEAGCRVASLPLACDTGYYRDEMLSAQVPGQGEIVFVGGYWPYKARQLDAYLKPFAGQLDVYGYSPWPYGRFGGQLPRDQEASLYAGAQVSPVINEPHACAMGIDLNERVFKVLGSGGLAVTDASAGYRDWFADGELLVPTSMAEYREMISVATNEPAVFEGYRARGKDAVLQRHTYKQRAEVFALMMSVALPA